MSRLRDELRLIHWVWWALALTLFLAIGSALVIPAVLGGRLGYWEHLSITLIALGAALIGSTYLLLIGYVAADSRRRGMRHVMWTLLAALVPNAIGIILYFILRDPLLVACPSCKHLSKANLAFCPQCGKPLARACPVCRRGVEADWVNCAYCGAPLGGQSINTA